MAWQADWLTASQKQKETPPGWETKPCGICENTPTNPCQMDSIEGRAHRKWSGRNFWGNVCWWRLRMLHVRYAWFSIRGFQRWVNEAPEHRREAKLASYAYISLRCEGRTQVNSQLIVARVDRVGLYRRLSIVAQGYLVWRGDLLPS